MKITFTGKTSHAAAPEDGISPGQVMAHLMQALPLIGPGGDMQDGFALATLTHAQLGEPSFGIAPGSGELRMTLRSQTDARMDQMVSEAETLIQAAPEQTDGLAVDISWHVIWLEFGCPRGLQFKTISVIVMTCWRLVFHFFF